jgi:hypothetical protein
MMSQPPTGMVTLLLTDIEGSTSRWEHHPQARQVAFVRHEPKRIFQIVQIATRDLQADFPAITTLDTHPNSL